MRTDIVNGIPKDTERWLYEVLHTLALNQESAGRGLDAITRGEAPDGSGSALFNDSLLFKLPGRSGGQDAHGDTAPGGNLTLSSTNSDTKGFIYLGDAQTSMFDEANQRIGLNTVPLARLHQKHTAVETMERWEGPNVDVTSSVCNGTTTVTHGSFGFAALSIGMVVYGVGVPTATYITGATASSLTLNNAVTAGTKTLSFANIIDLNYEVNGSGSDAVFRSSSGIVFIGSSLTGGQQSGVRLTAQTAFDGVIRAFIEAGPGSANMAITGNNGGNGDSLQQLFSRVGINTFDGFNLTGLSRVGINQDPYAYSGSAITGQPDALIIARRTGATSTDPSYAVSPVPTVIIEGPLTTVDNSHATIPNVDYALAITSPSLGSALTKVIGTPVAGFRHTGDLVLFTGSNVEGLLNAANVHGASHIFFNITRNSDSSSVLSLGSNAAWSDGITDAQSKFALIGDLIGGHRAFFSASSGFAPFTRYGISAAYTLVSNGQAGGFASSFPAPDGSVLKVLNTSTLGTDASIGLKIQTDRAGQTGDLLQLVGSAGTALGGFTATGAIYLVSGAAVGKVLTSGAGGVGSWSTVSSLLPADVAYLDVAQTWSAAQLFDIDLITGGGGVAFTQTPDGATPFLTYTDANTGKVMNWVGPAITADYNIGFPSSTGGILVFTATTQTLTNKTFGANGLINMGAAAAQGTKLTRGTSTSLYIQLNLASVSAVRTLDIGDVPGLVEIVGSGANPPATGAMGKVALTAQAAAIAATKLTDTTPAGMYEVSYYMETTTANVADGTLTFQINYTDTVGATNQITVATLALAATTTGTTALSGKFVVKLASGNITYQTNLTGAQTTSRYALTVRIKYLG